MSGRRKDNDKGLSNRTSQVMRLVEKEDMFNNVVTAGKSRVPRQLRGIEPLSRMMRREARQTENINPVDSGKRVTLNLTALVIKDNVEQVLQRFNACACDQCVETLSQMAAEKVPAKFIKIPEGTSERSQEIESAKEPLQKPVVSALTRLVMTNKKRSFHDL